MNTLKDRYEDVLRRVHELNPKAKLVVVTKAQTIADIQTLYDCGERNFGESYFDEWEKKAAELPDDIDWHFIGPMQSKKVKKFKPLMSRSSLVQSLDRSSVLSILDDLGPKISTLVQVNLWGETQKGGKSGDELEAFLDEIERCENVKCLGLMAIPPFTKNLEETKRHFSDVRDLYNSLTDKYGFRELSIGMSSDFESAIETGATMVRVGSAIFGSRS